MNTLKLVLLSLVGLAAAVVLWPFAIAGLLAYALAGMTFNRWVSSGVALGLVVGWRVFIGGWVIRIGDSASQSWYLELLPGIVSWALAAIFVSAFAQWPTKFRDGYRSELSNYRESPL